MDAALNVLWSVTQYIFLFKMEVVNVTTLVYWITRPLLLEYYEAEIKSVVTRETEQFEYTNWQATHANTQHCLIHVFRPAHAHTNWRSPMKLWYNKGYWLSSWVAASEMLQQVKIQIFICLGIRRRHLIFLTQINSKQSILGFHQSCDQN